MHTLLVLDPGHFHAALSLRDPHPLLADDVFVYGPPGPELDKFLHVVESFNRRALRPTRWRMNVVAGDDPLERLIAERRGDVVIVAGRNDGKMAAIHRLHAAGLHVFGDKPWAIDSQVLPLLEEVVAGGALALDIMTERHEVGVRLQKALLGVPAVFGEPLVAAGGEATIALESVHHLYKLVNGEPLERPPWYFDVEVQGRGIVDVATHLVDLAQWMIGGEDSLDYGRDLELGFAERWSTPVPESIFRRITGLSGFPDGLRGLVHAGWLDYSCNGRFGYRLRGIPVRIEAVWALEIPPGGGDTHRIAIRGTRSELVLDHGAETGFRSRLRVVPRAGEAGLERALEQALAGWQDRFPGVAIGSGAEGFELHLPEALRTTHEEHFAMALDGFLRRVEAGSGPGQGGHLLAKYKLLAEVGAMAAAREQSAPAAVEP